MGKKGGRQHGHDRKIERNEDNTRGTIHDRILQNAGTAHEAQRVLAEYADLDGDADYDELRLAREELYDLSYENAGISRADDAKRSRRMKELTDFISDKVSMFKHRKVIKIHKDLVTHCIRYLKLPYHCDFVTRRGNERFYPNGKRKHATHYDVVGPCAHWRMFLFPPGYRTVVIEYDGAVIVNFNQDGLSWGNINKIPSGKFFDWRQVDDDQKRALAYTHALAHLHAFNRKSIESNSALDSEHKKKALAKLKEPTLVKLEKFLTQPRLLN